MSGKSVVVIGDRDSVLGFGALGARVITPAPEAEEVRVATDFDSALKGFAIDRSAFIVIVTRGHLHDKTVLMQALRTEAAYIGMIGSRRKRDHIFNALLKQGFTEADLKRVHSPIGLDIDAETPEEIALSIVAEMVHARAQGRRA
jgi:xanthine dehydrogenase accessory factor